MSRMNTYGGYGLSSSQRMNSGINGLERQVNALQYAFGVGGFGDRFEQGLDRGDYSQSATALMQAGNSLGAQYWLPGYGVATNGLRSVVFAEQARDQFRHGFGDGSSANIFSGARAVSNLFGGNALGGFFGGEDEYSRNRSILGMSSRSQGQSQGGGWSLGGALSGIFGSIGGFFSGLFGGGRDRDEQPEQNTQPLPRRPLQLPQPEPGMSEELLLSSLSPEARAAFEEVSERAGGYNIAANLVSSERELMVQQAERIANTEGANRDAAYDALADIAMIMANTEGNQATVNARFGTFQLGYDTAATDLARALEGGAPTVPNNRSDEQTAVAMV